MNLRSCCAATHILAFVLACAALAGGSLPASAQFGPYFLPLVNGGGSSLVVATNGAVTECSGRLGFNDQPGLECKTIGVISVPTTGGLYHLEAFGNSAGLPQGQLFRNASNGQVWGCSQTADINGLPTGQCVQFNSVPTDANPPFETQTTVGALTSVNSESRVTITDILSTGVVFECTTFLSKETSGTPTGQCKQIGTITAVPTGVSVTGTHVGDVVVFYASTTPETTRLGQCVSDYNSSTLAPVGACIK